MKNFRKSFLIALLIIFIMGGFILYPFECTDLHLKLTFSSDSAYTECTAYYTTVQNPVYSEEQSIAAIIDNGKADIVFPKELCKSLTGLRLDFSQNNDLIGITRVELCSAGFAQTTMDASDFFAAANILATNDISVIQPVQTTAYIGTDDSDPHVLFQTNIVEACNDAYSHYTFSKFALFAFIILSYILARKNLFAAD